MNAVRATVFVLFLPLLTAFSSSFCPLEAIGLGASSALASASPAVRVSAQAKLCKSFRDKGLAYPPRDVTFLVIKDEMNMEIWSKDDHGKDVLVDVYDFVASGRCGPKLARGDLQVPEGFYKVVGLNPNSRYHLSMKLDYPNRFDIDMAKSDGRRSLGGDIFIHGNAKSMGCIAVGDRGIEELYQLVSDAGVGNVRVIIAPYDFRDMPIVKINSASLPKWAPALYKDIEREMARFAKSVKRPQPAAIPNPPVRTVSATAQ